MSKHHLVAAVFAVVAIAAVTATAVAQPSQRFDDVPADHYAFDAVAWLADNDITTGYDDGTFKPDRTVTRAHVAAFLYRYHQNVILGGDGDGDILAGALTVTDSYWSADGDTYYVQLAGLGNSTHCEVHLTLEGRRTGEWGIEVWTGRRATVTVAVNFVDYAFDAFEIECS